MRVTQLTVLLVAFAATVSAQNMDPTLVARSKEFTAAVQALDAAKVGSFYAEDAVVFDTSGMAKGRPAVQKAMAGGLKILSQMSHKIVDARTSGDLGYIFGTFSFPASVPAPNGGRSGNYLTVWKRIGGQWLIAYDTFSDDPKPATAK